MKNFIIYSRKSRNAQDGHRQLTHETGEWEINQYLKSLDRQGIEYRIYEKYEEDYSAYGYYNNRPIFSHVVKMCKRNPSLTLLAAKADRVARDVWSGAELIKTINMVIATDPNADDSTLQMMFTWAEKECKSISDRFKAAAAAKRARCEAEGKPFYWGASSPNYGKNSKGGNPNTRKRTEAAKRVERLRDPIRVILATMDKPSYSVIAEKLTKLGEDLPSGKPGVWHKAQVKRVMDRLGMEK